MSSIKFNQLTKEIELNGSESFIASNFKLLSFVKMTESQPATEMERKEVSEEPQILLAAKSAISDIPHGVKATRPPLRKYIRREGLPGHQRVVVEVVQQKPRELSIASLKEKFGLPESKIGGVIRDAEKLGKVRRALDGSYVWAQD